MCGDSTKESDVNKLMNGEKADMVFTDPPYGCDLKSTRLGEEVINDELEGDDLINFFDAVFKNIPLKDWGVLYWFYSTNRVAETRAIAEKYYKLKDTIIWVKDSFVPGRNDYHNKFEPILYLEKIGKGEVKRIWNGQRDKSNVWNFDRDRNVKHPTNKPVQLIKFALLNSSNKNNIIIDPFLGSGSTLIACEKTNRVCYGMELDTKYCDVIIERWEQFTGQKAKKCGV
jgi:DNA modification methylase